LRILYLNYKNNSTILQKNLAKYAHPVYHIITIAIVTGPQNPVDSKPGRIPKNPPFEGEL
jgi:hypothetical protein